MLLVHSMEYCYYFTRIVEICWREIANQQKQDGNLRRMEAVKDSELWMN